MEDGRFRVVIGRLGKVEAGRKKVEITDASLNNLHRLKYIEKKLIDKGVLKLERHPGDGLSRNRRQPKSGHGGKFTWEGPRGIVDNELFDDVPSAMDKGDPNYVDEDEEEEWEEFNYVHDEEEVVDQWKELTASDYEELIASWIVC